MGILENNPNKNCINECNRCAVICLGCVRACSHSTKSATQFFLCVKSASFIVCEACTKECEMFKDAHCTECAQVCKICAGECNKTAGM